MPPKPRGKDTNATHPPQAAAEARDAFRKGPSKSRNGPSMPPCQRRRALAEDCERDPRGRRKGQGRRWKRPSIRRALFDAAGQGATAFNRSHRYCRAQSHSGFDLAKSLAGAKNLAEIEERESAFIPDEFDVFAS